MRTKNSPNRPPRRRIGITLLIASLVLALVGTATRGSAQSTPEASSLDAGAIGGLAPIERVVAHFETRVDASPSDYLHRTQLGHALLVMAQEQADLVAYERAEATFADALERNPSHAPALLGRGQALAAQHQFTDAVALAEQVLLERPGWLPAELLVADASFELGDTERARTIWSALASGNDSAVLTSRLARLAEADGDVASAITYAAQARDLAAEQILRPNALAFYDFQLAHFHWLDNDAPGALAALDNALALDPDHVGAIELSAEVHRASGDLETAAALYARMLELAPAADLHGLFAEVQLELGNEALAAEHEAIGMALALEHFERFPTERDHILDFLSTRDPQLAAELVAEYADD